MSSRLGLWFVERCWKLVDGIGGVWAGWPQRHALGLIVVLALLLRLVPVFFPSMIHPDEIFQYLEPAHRLVTGYGIVTWDWREGIRSWFLPLVLAGPIALSEKLWPESLVYLPVIRGLCAVASLSVVLSFYALGSAVSRFHGLIAAFVAAIWFDLVFYASHTLGEPLALALIMLAAAVLCRPDTATKRRLVAAGLVLGFAVIIRYQYLPAIGVLVALTCKLRIRDLWLPIAIGGAAALLIGAAIDLSLGVMPFEWVFNNFHANVIAGRAKLYGVSGPLYYPIYLAQSHWQSSTWLILALAALAAYRYPALLMAALVNVLLLSLVGHKEFRFVLLSTTIGLLFFSLGLADGLRYLGGRMSARGRTLLMVVATLCVATSSASLAVSGERRYEWTVTKARLMTMQAANRSSGLCGLAIYQIHPWDLGGYTYLDRRVPMHFYEKSDTPALHRDAASFNVIVAPLATRRSLPVEYVPGACFEDDYPWLPRSNDMPTKCVFQRPGTCKPGAMEINQALVGKDL